eukprot:s4967_g12.t1
MKPSSKYKPQKSEAAAAAASDAQRSSASEELAELARHANDNEREAERLAKIRRELEEDLELQRESLDVGFMKCRLLSILGKDKAQSQSSAKAAKGSERRRSRSPKLQHIASQESQSQD